jgi:2-amino-4-hydroxy-6-hydroxymethyldihydropteridine diphosphokinase
MGVKKSRSGIHAMPYSPALSVADSFPHPPDPMATAYLALGSNLGDRRARLAAAVGALGALPATRLGAAGGVYETAPVGPADQGDFLNTVVRLETRLTPRELLAAGQAIEARLGRKGPRERRKWGPREMDVDLLLFGACAFGLADFTLPHPRMAGRWFVLRPLADIAPDLVPPGWGLTVAAALARLEHTDPSCRGTPHVA